MLALLAPSGCGKSTLLRAIAGLEPIQEGRICWDATDLAGVPVHRRGFGLMFQDGVLFPHRDVAGNIGYGLRRAQLDRAEIRSRVGELLELVGLPGYGARRVGTLSGGEAQRVALARAAHDQGEAFAVADRLAVLRAGVLRQTGTARDVWSHPADDWVAGFVGYSTLLDAAAAARIGAPVPAPGQLLGLRPAALVLDPAGPLTGRAVLVSTAPDGVLLTVRLDGVDGLGEVRAIGAADDLSVAGDPVRLRLAPAATALLPCAATSPAASMAGP